MQLIAAGVVATALLTWLLRTLAPGLGWIAPPNPIVPQHRSPVAVMGGIAIVTGALVAGALARLPVDRATVAWALPCLLFLAVGIRDDLKPLSPAHKMAAQVLIAALAVTLGAGARITGRTWLDTSLAVAWIVVLVNAVNMTDVCDGLAAGLAAIGLLAIGMWAPPVRGVAWSLAGACIGFLLFNRPPATIFMGDAGSLPLGFSLAFVTLRALEDHGGWPRAMLALGASAVFLFELAFLIGVRTARGIPAWKGSPDHFALRMQAAGWSRWHTDLVSWGVAGGVCLLTHGLSVSAAGVRVAGLALLMLSAGAAATWLLRHEVRRG